MRTLPCRGTMVISGKEASAESRGVYHMTKPREKWYMKTRICTTPSSLRKFILNKCCLWPSLRGFDSSKVFLLRTSSSLDSRTFCKNGHIRLLAMIDASKPYLSAEQIRSCRALENYRVKCLTSAILIDPLV